LGEDKEKILVLPPPSLVVLPPVLNSLVGIKKIKRM